jgi:hypothetical protein
MIANLPGHVPLVLAGVAGPDNDEFVVELLAEK